MSMVHPMARTTPRTRAEIHDSPASVAELAQTYNISRSTARKWRNRDDQLDHSHRAHQLHTTLSSAQELIVMEIRRLCLLPLDDLVAVTKQFINADASRSGISRLLRREGMSKLSDLEPKAEGEETSKKTFKDYEPGFVHIDIKYLPKMPDEDQHSYSRTNRIFDATKTFGNIVTFRDQEQATIDAITLFGDKNTKNVVLEKSYTEYMEGFTDVLTGEARRGFMDVVQELETRFPDPAAIEKEADKKAFAKLFGEYLRVENILQNYDEFTRLKELQNVDVTDSAAAEAFKVRHHLSDDDLVALQALMLPAERKIQDYRSTYNDVRDWLRREKAGAEKEKSSVDWDDVVFEVDLLKSQEINLDYILELIFEHNKKVKSKSALVDEVRRVIRASLGHRAKESLVVDFINQTDLDQIGDAASVIEAFYAHAQAEMQREAQELIAAEDLNADAAKRYITTSLRREFASDNGTELNAVLPKMSPLNPLYLTKKQSVFQKIVAFVEKYKGVGGQIQV